MEQILAEKRVQDADTSGIEAFNPNLADGWKVRFQPSGQHLATALYETSKYLLKDDINQTNPDIAQDSNIIFKVMNIVFGTYGLYELRSP